MFAPQNIGGIGIVPFNVIITQHKIKFLQRHLRKNNEIGNCIIINLKWAMLHAGRRNAIFTSDGRIDYIENQRIIHLHNELKRMTGKLLIRGITGQHYSRVNDQFLMDAWDYQNLSIASLYQLNLFHLYLRVSKLSDIVSNDGKHIQYVYLTSTRINTHSNLEWPRQSRPSQDAWKFWKKTLIDTFYTVNHLTHPLGPWTNFPPNVTYF